MVKTVPRTGQAPDGRHSRDPAKPLAGSSAPALQLDVSLAEDGGTRRVFPALVDPGGLMRADDARVHAAHERHRR